MMMTKTFLTKITILTLPDITVLPPGTLNHGVAPYPSCLVVRVSAVIVAILYLTMAILYLQ